MPIELSDILRAIRGRHRLKRVDVARRMIQLGDPYNQNSLRSVFLDRVELARPVYAKLERDSDRFARYLSALDLTSEEIKELREQFGEVSQLVKLLDTYRSYTSYSTASNCSSSIAT